MSELHLGITRTGTVSGTFHLTFPAKSPARDVCASKEYCKFSCTNLEVAQQAEGCHVYLGGFVLALQWAAGWWLDMQMI